jgi:UDP-N-acetylmuramyl pentapeptide synthase
MTIAATKYSRSGNSETVAVASERMETMTTNIRKLTSKARYLLLAAVAAAGMGFVAPAFAGGPVTAAIACAVDNDFQPAQIFDVRLDLDGDYTVLVRDGDGDLWECNSGPDGYIYYNNMLRIA